MAMGKKEMQTPTNQTVVTNPTTKMEKKESSKKKSRARNKIFRSLSPKRFGTSMGSSSRQPKKYGSLPRQTSVPTKEEQQQKAEMNNEEFICPSKPTRKESVIRTRSFGCSMGGGTVTDCSEQLVFFDTPSEGLQIVQYQEEQESSDESSNSQDDDDTVATDPFQQEQQQNPKHPPSPRSVVVDDKQQQQQHQEDYSSLSDADLFQALEDATEYEKYVLVGRYLKELESRGIQQLPGDSNGSNRFEALKRTVQQVQEVIDSHSQDASNKQTGWKKHGLMTGKHRNTMVYHRTDEITGGLTVRCETPIPASLVSPLLAILNETDLYTTWCPSFQRPFKLGISETGKHKQCSRASQIAFAKVNMPWPMNNREVIVKNVMAEAVDEMGAIVIRAKTMEDGEQEEGFVVPPCESGWDRIQMDAGLLLQKCPLDHPALSQKKKQQQKSPEEPMVLATFTLFVAPSINTILKVIAGPMWAALIGFANDVDSGKNGELHRQRISEKPELHSWVDETVQRMMEVCK